MYFVVRAPSREAALNRFVSRLEDEPPLRCEGLLPRRRVVVGLFL